MVRMNDSKYHDGGKACREKSAEVVVPKACMPIGKDQTLFKRHN